MVGLYDLLSQPVGERQARMNVLPLAREIEYPTSDGQPMAESPEHVQAILELLLGLQRRYAGVSDVWVGANFYLFYEPGNPKARVSPDVLLAQGVANWNRPNYLLWREKPPSLVVEVTSRKTWRKDLGSKKSLYERIGVEEYVLFDPLGECLRPPLQGYRLLRGRYQPIPLAEDGSLLSRTTGLRFRSEGARLRLEDARTGEPILWPEEVEAARAREAAGRQAAEAKAAEEAAARKTAEARTMEAIAAQQTAEERVRALEEELKRLRKI
jgi:Uma2 family endonuclease